MTVDTFMLAGKAHFQIVKDIIDIQARIVQRKDLVAEFGEDAVEPTQMLIDRKSVSQAAEKIRWADQRDRERLAELLDAAKAMEEVFKTKSDADMEDFVAYWKERFKSEQSSGG